MAGNVIKSTDTAAAGGIPTGDYYNDGTDIWIMTKNGLERLTDVGGSTFTSPTVTNMIVGASTTGITISGACTTGISMSGDGTTGFGITAGFSGANMISLAGTGSNAGVLISGACGKGVEITGSCTTGIGILTGTYTTGISIAGTTATGIDIGTCTTGINYSGTITEGIDFGSATLTTDAARENSFIKCGTVTTQKTVTLSTDNQAYLFQANCLIAGALGTDKRVILHYNKLQMDTANTGARLKCNENYTVVGAEVKDAHVIYGELFWKSGYTGVGVNNEGFGVAGTVDTTGAATEPTGLLYGGKFRIKGANLRTGSYGHLALFVVSEVATHTSMCIEHLTGNTTNLLWIRNDAGTNTNGLRLEAIGGTMTNAISIGTCATGINMAGGYAFVPILVGAKANTSGSGVKLAGGTDDSGGVQIYADDGGAAVVGDVLSPIRCRYLLTASQSGGKTQCGSFSQLRINDTLTMTNGGYRGTYIFNQIGSNLTLAGTAELVGINQATTILTGTHTVGTSCRFAGVDINVSGAGTISVTGSGKCAGMIIRSSGTPVWTNGILIEDSGAATGIRVGTCATAGIGLNEDVTLCFGSSNEIAASWTGQELFFEDDRTIDVEDGYNRTIHVGNTITMTASRYAAFSNYTTLAGSLGLDAYGAKFSMVQGATKAVDGHFGAIMGEVKNNADTCSTASALFLRWDNDNSYQFGTAQSFIRFEDNSSGTAVQNLLDLYGMDATTGASATAITCAAGAANTVSHVIKIMIGGVPYWIMMDSTPPA